MHCPRVNAATCQCLTRIIRMACSISVLTYRYRQFMFQAQQKIFYVHQEKASLFMSNLLYVFSNYSQNILCICLGLKSFNR
jgi:hypothetical protein